jgi:hypothetical protein
MPDVFFPTPTAQHAPYPVTMKKRATAGEIQADLQGRINRLAARKPTFRGCTAPRPYLSSARTGTAANWTVDGFPGQPPGGFSTLAQLLDQAQREYELIG